MKYIAQLILKLIGWKAVFKPLPACRGIIVVYPHTSNWDFPLGVLWKFAVGMQPRWVAKEEWFKPPFGWIMRALGGIGIKRSGNLDVTQQLSDKMLSEPDCWLCIAPEGTRSRKEYIHMGYYHIAKAANVLLGIGYIDYKTKTISVQTYRPVKATPAEELAQLAIDFEGIVAYNPDKVSNLKLRL